MRTYVDSGVLITAARGVPDLSAPAIEMLGDTTREFVSSDWVKLEVLPKAQFFNRGSEVAFYETYFRQVSIWVPFSGDLLAEAFAEASYCGLSAVDAIHVILAAGAQCDELVTSEKPSSAIHRSKLLRIVSIGA